MDITVIIPSYKPDRYIERCLLSIGEQTLSTSNFEIIIVLNGCSEPWLSQIRNFVRKNLSQNNVRIIQIDNAGVSNARNVAIGLAKGEYITFIDDDDYVSSKYLESLLLVANKETVSVSDSCAFIDDSNEILENYSPHKNYQRSEDKKNVTILDVRSIFNGPWMKLIHRNIISNIKFDDTLSNGEDSLFMFEISKNIKYVSLASPDAIYYRRFRVGSAFKSKHSMAYWLKNGIKLGVRYCKLYFKNPLNYKTSIFFRFLLSNIKGTLLYVVKNT